MILKTQTYPENQMTYTLSKDIYSQSVEKQYHRLIVVHIYITYHLNFCSEMILEPQRLFNIEKYPSDQTNTNPIVISPAPAL